MKHLKTTGLALVGALALAACNTAPVPPTVGTSAQEAELPPVTGGTINRPDGSTAAAEFVVKGERAAKLAKALGLEERTDALEAQSADFVVPLPIGLRDDKPKPSSPIDTRPLPIRSVMALDEPLRPLAAENELRILVAVTRAKSGEFVGQKRAVATFVWGNQKERLTFDAKAYPTDDKSDLARRPVNVWLGVKGGASNIQDAKSNLDLKVKFPDFQAKTTKNTPYMPDAGAMCANVTFDLLTVPDDKAVAPMTFNNFSTPLQVCEGEAERLAEKTALERASSSLKFSEGDSLPMPFSWVNFDDQKSLPTADGFAALASLPAGTTVTTQTLDEFFAPLTKLTGYREDDAVAKKYEALKKQFGVYYRETRVYRAKVGADRSIVYVLGLNGWGVGGLKTQILAK